MEEVNIIDLIEKNPITKLNSNYNGKLLNKIKENFTELQQKVFVTSFYCFLNYDDKQFIIDFDNVWKWLEFSQKSKAKRLLENYFVIDVDYKILLVQMVKQKGSGGGNKENIMLNLNTFKKFCIRAGTKKADEVHDYFLKLEKILQEVINEESQELREQLKTLKKTSEEQLKESEEKLKETEEELKNVIYASEEELKNVIYASEEEKYKLREKTLLDQFPKNTQCVYVGLIDNKSTANESLIKFGNSNDVAERVICHKKTYSNFRLMNVFKVSNKLHIENAMKQHPVFKKKRRNILIENVNYTELFAIDGFTMDEIDTIINKIIAENEYNIGNYTKLLESKIVTDSENEKLRKENKKLMDDVKILQTKVDEFDPKRTREEQKRCASISKNTNNDGFLLYAFKMKENRFKCSICRAGDFENQSKMYVGTDFTGETSLSVKVMNSFTEKVAHFLLRHHLTRINNDTFDGDLNDIKTIYDIVAKQEEQIMVKNMSLEDILSSLSNNIVIENTMIDPEVPAQRKAMRAIDQINVDTGAILASYPSIEAAGRAIGLTTGTAIGIALRNKTLCKGFLFRYSGISREDQYSSQPVIKVCCSTGVKLCFENMADAARDCKISAPGLRNRILTKVHIDDFHWIFDKNSTHYK